MLSPAYVAGLLDGEGCLTISRVNRNSKRAFQPTVTIQMAHEDVIRELQADFGGSLARRQQKPSWSVQWAWTITSEAHVRQFLAQILPFLLVKRQQAQILLSYFDARSKMGSTSHRTEAERDELEALCTQIQFANRKGHRVAA